MATEESREDLEVKQGTAQYWLLELEMANQEEEEWRKRGKRVIERYRDERNVDTISVGFDKKFNILWSNTETLKGALFARMAKPDVRRRFPDPNPIARQIARVIERSLMYGMDIYNAEKPIEAAVEDFLLPGRGVVWVVYDPILVKETTEVEVVNEDGSSITSEVEEERVAEQRCYFDYVHWEDYRENPAKRPEDVTWKARRHLLTKDELEEKGFSNIDDIP